MVPEAALHDGRNARGGLRGRPRRRRCASSLAPERLLGAVYISPRACMGPARGRAGRRWRRRLRRRGRRRRARQAAGGGARSSTSSRRTRCCGPTAASTPSATRTSRTWPPTPPGSRTRSRSTTRPSSRCRRSWTRSRRGAAPRPTTAATRAASTTSWTGSGYEMVDVESGEALCPPRICPGARTHAAGGAQAPGRRRAPAARLHAWIGAIRKRDRPTFYLQHALLPHEPWIYLPSGRQSRPQRQRPDPGDQRARRASTTRRSRTTTRPATCSRWASWTGRWACCWRGCAAPGCSTRR